MKSRQSKLCVQFSHLATFRHVSLKQSLAPVKSSLTHTDATAPCGDLGPVCILAVLGVGGVLLILAFPKAGGQHLGSALGNSISPQSGSAHGWTGYTSKQNLVFTTSGGRLVPCSKIFHTHPKSFGPKT